MQSKAINAWRGALCCALIWSLPSSASPPLQLQVLEGDGATYRIGTRSASGITVLVTGEAGQPVDKATVTFHLPDQGPSGAFNSGQRNETVTTGPDGRATVWGMQWNKTAGPVEIRITAVKDQARAGIFATEYLNDAVPFQKNAVEPSAPEAGGTGVFTASHSGHGKWILIGVLVGGAAAAGFALSHSKGSSTTSTAMTPGISIGAPNIVIGGHP